MEFCDLHGHTTYSQTDGWGTPIQVVARAKELGRKSIAITDHGTISGYVQFDKACKEAGIHSVFGYESYFVKSIDEMFEKKARKKNHLTILAMNQKGYANILKLASLAYQKGFYYSPTIDSEILFTHSEGLIVLSGCWSGILQRMLVAKNDNVARRFISQFKEVFEDRFYLETQHYTLFQETYPELKELSKEYKIPIVLTCDTHFPYPGQARNQEILHAIRDRRLFDGNNVIPDAYQWAADDLHKLVESRFGGPWGRIFDNTCDVACRCNVEMVKGSSPKYTSPQGRTSDEEISILCKEGIDRLGLKGAGDVYNKRYARELKVIKDKNFTDYLLIAADTIKWAKDNNIFVGGGRGSSAGSLLCNLLGITTIDPIKHGTMFERFIDETRDDPPDIDTDFEATKRDLVKDYVVSKYGDDKVCDVATFSKFRGKNSLDEIKRIFEVPFEVIEKVKSCLVEREPGDERYDFTIQDTIDSVPQVAKLVKEYPRILDATILEGQMRHMGKHAAGVLIGAQPLDEVIAIYERDGRKLSCFEMNDSASLGLIKFDFLGLKELTVLENVCGQIGWTLDDIYKIPLDDKLTLEGFKKTDVEGVFQFGGYATKAVLKEMPYIEFKQLADCVALSRPGVRGSGATDNYIARMNGKKSPGWDWNPILKEITKDTFGQVIYQEQLLRLLREFAGFSIQDANKCRKTFSKKKGVEEFDKQYWPVFLSGVKDKISEEKAKELWEGIKEFGKYSFNFSHSVSYAILAFWVMYLKRHYPIEFFLSALNSEEKDEEEVKIIRNAVSSGVQIKPPMLGKSGVKWQREDKNTLRAGLLSLKGIGPKTAEILVNEKYTCRADLFRKTKGITSRVEQVLEEYKAIPFEKAKYARCVNCPLKSCTAVKGQNGKSSDLVIVGEAPGGSEEVEGKPFVGRSGELLNDVLSECGINRDDVYILNSVCCRPSDEQGNNRKPTEEEVRCCRERLLYSLSLIKPKIVLALGGTAYYSLILPEGKMSEVTMNKVVGICQQSNEGYNVIVGYHPAYILRNPTARDVFKKHIQEAKNLSLEVKDGKKKRSKNKKNSVVVDTVTEETSEVVDVNQKIYKILKDNKSTKGALITRGDDPALIVRRIPFGIEALDRLTQGGVPLGKMSMIYGASHVGKSFIAQQLIKSAQLSNKSIAFIDIDKGFEPSWWVTVGVDIKNLCVIVPQYGEQAWQIAHDLMAGQVDLVVMDSVDFVVPVVEAEATMEQKFIGTVSRLNADGLRKARMINTNTALICLSHVAEGVGKYSGHNVVGGKALENFSSLTLWVVRGPKISENEVVKGGDETKKVGFKMRVTIEKHKVGGHLWEECELPFTFEGGGIDSIGGLIELCLEMDVIGHKGPKYDVLGEELFGKLNVKQYLLDHEDVQEQLRQKLTEVK